MLPRELPISQDALDVAEATMFAMKGDPRSAVVEATILSFLQAEGFEVEETAAYTKDNLRIPHFTNCVLEEPGWKRVEPLTRLVSPWKAAPSSTEGGEGS